MKKEIKIPNLGDNISSAEIVKILVKVGDKVQKDQPILEIGSDKANIEIPSEFDGVVDSILLKEGDLVSVNQLALTITTGEIPPEVKPVVLTPLESKPEVKKEVKLNNISEKTILDTTTELRIKGTVVPAAPSIRRFSREIGIDINKVKGTGQNGRISIEDVKAFSKALNTQKSTEPLAPSRSTNTYHEVLPDFSKWGEIKKETMNNVRLKTAQHLTFAWNNIPHVTHFEKIDITEVEKWRKQYAKKAEVLGGKLTITAILAKVVALALKNFPRFNASIDVENKEIIYKNYYNIGIAVDTDRGLLVPVIKEANNKNILQLSADLAVIAEKAKSKKLAIEDMQGATFTISNLGGIGGIAFTPVVNYPEVAILGISKSSYEPVYIEETFVPRLMMPISLSYDHRLIDGADAARFVKWIKEAVENPFLLILEG